MSKSNFFKQYPDIKKRCLLMFFSFIAIFLLRLAYEVYLADYSSPVTTGYSQPDLYMNAAYPLPDGYSSFSSFTNIGTYKMIQRNQTGQDITINQKYEKSANLTAGTDDFQKDNQILREIIEANHGVIQSENLTGLQGHQKLTMAVGVMPDYFDRIVEELKTIGTLQSFTVNKTDKTAEFRSLLAEQETLEKTRDSYIAIKDEGGSINDLLQVTGKIIEVERELQNLGVSLGSYASESSLCTINLTLRETESAVEISSSGITPFVLMECAARSLSWTFYGYVVLIVIILGILLAAALTLKLTISIKKSIAVYKMQYSDKGK